MLGRFKTGRGRNISGNDRRIGSGNLTWGRDGGLTESHGMCFPEDTMWRRSDKVKVSLCALFSHGCPRPVLRTNFPRDGYVGQTARTV